MNKPKEKGRVVIPLKGEFQGKVGTALRLIKGIGGVRLGRAIYVRLNGADFQNLGKDREPA